PGRPRTGDVISGAEGAGVLHAGTRRRDDGTVVSAGGRVLAVVGQGPDLAAARDDAYRLVREVHLAGAHYRTDIAARATAGEIPAPYPTATTQRSGPPEKSGPPGDGSTAGQPHQRRLAQGSPRRGNP